MIRLKLSKTNILNALIALLMITIWAFNETKIVTYPVKIICILAFGIYTVNSKHYNSKYQLWCILMIVLTIIASLIAPDKSASLYATLNMFQVFLLAFTIYGYIDSEEKIIFVLKCIVIAGIVLAVRLVLVTPANVWLSWKRLGEAIGSNSNDIGNKAAFSAIVALCLSKNTKNKRFLYFAACSFMSVIVLFSGSRKALLALVVALILLNTIGLQDKRKVLFSVIGIMVLLYVGYSFIMNNNALYMTIGRRIETMIDVLFHGGSEAQSIDLREKYIETAWRLIKAHPIMGIGLNNFASVSGLGVYSHCDYTEVACSYGLIGAFIYYFPLLSVTFKNAKKRHKSNVDYVFLILQLVLLITFITMIMYTSVYTQVLVALFIAEERVYATGTRDKSDSIFRSLKSGTYL